MVSQKMVTGMMECGNGYRAGSCFQLNFPSTRIEPVDLHELSGKGNVESANEVFRIGFWDT